MWKHLSKKKTMAETSGTKRTNDDGDGAPTVSPPPSKGLRGSVQTMNVDTPSATDPTKEKPAEVPAQPTAATNQGSKPGLNDEQGEPRTPGNTGNGNEVPQETPDGDTEMADKNNPTAEEKEKAGKGVKFAGFQEVGEDVNRMYPWLVECKVRAGAGERPFDVFKECAEDLMKRLKNAKGTNANFKVGTLEKTAPFKSPASLPLDWTKVKPYIHVHGEQEDLFRKNDKGKQREVVVRLSFCFAGREEVCNEDVKDINMNLLTRDEIPF